MYQTKSFFSLTEYEVAQIALELWKAGVTNITKEKISYPECVALVKEAHAVNYVNNVNAHKITLMDPVLTGEDKIADPSIRSGDVIHRSSTMEPVYSDGNLDKVDPSLTVRY